MQASGIPVPTNTRFTPILFFSCWFLIGIIQASGTGLMDDEAYYWVYSRFLDWGYFDHPPMTAVLIKTGTLLFPGELGVRFFIVLLNTGTLWIIHAMLRKKNDVLFYWIAGGMAVLQIGGILAVPDLPLVFFIACFFFVYKRFCGAPTWANTVLLGFVMSAMLYSKYHGVLVVVFTLVSNPRLLRSYRAWLAVSMATLLFVPHLIWQYQHDYPSVQYHLFERNAVAYQAGFTIEYIFGQLAFMGPLIGWLLLFGAWKQKTENVFEKALKWNLFGILIFFGISTIKGRVEANWTVPVFVPLMLLGHQYLAQQRRWWPFLKMSAYVTVGLVLVVRVYLLADVKPLSWLKKDEFHKNEERALLIQKKANGRPVVFTNSYQAASKHWFYSGDTALSLNTVYYRRNNYNFWPIENQFQGREALVLLAPNAETRPEEKILTLKGPLAFYEDSCFQSRMGDWIDVPVKGSLENERLVQAGVYSAGNNPFVSCQAAPRPAGLWISGENVVFRLVHSITEPGLPAKPGGKAVFEIATAVPDTIFPQKSIRYGLSTSVPGVHTLNSRTIKIIE